MASVREMLWFSCVHESRKPTFHGKAVLPISGGRKARLSLEVKWSEVAQLCPTLCNPMDCSLPYSSIHGVFQARVLEWVAISFSRGSSQPRDQTWVSRIVVRCFTIWATREVTLFQSRSKYKMIPRIKFKPYHVISGSTWQEPMNKINKIPWICNMHLLYLLKSIFFGVEMCISISKE